VARRKSSGADIGDSTTLHLKQPPAPVSHGLRVSVIEGPDEGTSVVLGKRTAILGRSPSADLALTDPTVSTFHVEISSDEHGIRATDLDSSNGTLFAGARVTQAVVPSGSLLQLGASRVRVELDAPVPVTTEAPDRFGELRGRSRVMRELFAVLDRLARTDLSVLVEGPTGSGKELVAHALHDAGTRKDGPFVVLDCTAIPATLSESILFGHERGAFTGATDRRIGLFEAADHGTLFLDEVGELPKALQPKLLRVLETRKVRRIGGNSERAVDVRVVAATWRDVRAMINRGEFREDLYYRLAQARVVIPPLRDRAEDIAPLIEHFLASRPESEPGARTIAPDALEELAKRNFRGNVRELKNVVERAAVLAEGNVIGASDLAFERMITRAPEPTRNVIGFKEAKRTVVDEFEREYIERLLERTGGSLRRAAALAGIERHYFRGLCRKHGLRTAE